MSEDEDDVDELSSSSKFKLEEKNKVPKYVREYEYSNVDRIVKMVRKYHTLKDRLVGPEKEPVFVHEPTFSPLKVRSSSIFSILEGLDDIKEDQSVTGESSESEKEEVKAKEEIDVAEGEDMLYLRYEEQMGLKAPRKPVESRILEYEGRDDVVYQRSDWFSDTASTADSNFDLIVSSSDEEKVPYRKTKLYKRLPLVNVDEGKGIEVKGDPPERWWPKVDYEKLMGEQNVFPDFTAIRSITNMYNESLIEEKLDEFNDITDTQHSRVMESFTLGKIMIADKKNKMTKTLNCHLKNFSFLLEDLASDGKAEQMAMKIDEEIPDWTTKVPEKRSSTSRSRFEVMLARIPQNTEAKAKTRRQIVEEAMNKRKMLDMKQKSMPPPLIKSDGLDPIVLADQFETYLKEVEKQKEKKKRQLDKLKEEGKTPVVRRIPSYNSVVQEPSYSKVTAPYHQVCAERHRSRYKLYRHMFDKELTSLAVQQLFAISGVRIARAFINGAGRPIYTPEKPIN